MYTCACIMGLRMGVTTRRFFKQVALPFQPVPEMWIAGIFLPDTDVSHRQIKSVTWNVQQSTFTLTFDTVNVGWMDEMEAITNALEVTGWKRV